MRSRWPGAVRRMWARRSDGESLPVSPPSCAAGSPGIQAADSLRSPWARSTCLRAVELAPSIQGAQRDSLRTVDPDRYGTSPADRAVTSVPGPWSFRRARRAFEEWRSVARASTWPSDRPRSRRYRGRGRCRGDQMTAAGRFPPAPQASAAAVTARPARTSGARRSGRCPRPRAVGIPRPRAWRRSRRVRSHGRTSR